MEFLKSELVAILNETERLTENTAVSDSAITAASGKLNEYCPSLMLFGFYNAGKSTLLNAIMGDEMAKVSDSPETAIVSEYQFNDYTIYDTPGIDAPVEHEQISRDHLRKVDIVIFVASASGSFDEVGTKKEIDEIVASGRKVIIVLNNKTGLDSSSPELRDIYHQAQSHFTNAEAVLLVNAKSALKARLESKNRLLENSGLLDLERVVLKTLNETQGETLLQAPLNLLSEQLSNLETHYSSNLTSLENCLADTLLSRVQEAKTSLVNLCMIDLQAIRQKFTDRFLVAIKNNADLDQQAEPYYEEARNSFERRRAEVVQKLDNEIEKFLNSPELQQSQIYIQAKSIGGTEEGFENPILKKLLNKDCIDKALQSEGTAELIKKALMQGRKWKIPKLKGRWEKTFTKWTPKIQKGLGVGLQVAISGYEAYKAYSDHQKQIQAQKDYEQAIQVAAAEVCSQIETQLSNNFLETSREVFADSESTFRQLAEKNSFEKSEENTKLNKIRSLQDRCHQAKLILENN